MDISPDAIIYYEWGAFKLNATIVFTWLVMAILVGVSWLITRNLTADPDMAPGQNFLEAIVELLRDQIKEIGQQEAERYLPFVGTLFIFIAFANLLAIVPGYQPPTGSLSTTAALAICVFVAVPMYGVYGLGFVEYLKQYLRPNPIMLPFNIIGELSRTLALAVRLFGNVMSGTMIAAVLISIVPLFFPIVMQLLGLITGFIQAYIFAVLAMVYIASATRVQGKGDK